MISTVALMWKDGLVQDSDIHAELGEILSGDKCPRENDDEIIYFNAVGLAYVDVSITYAMYKKCLEAGVGTWTYLQEKMIFEKDLTGKVRF